MIETRSSFLATVISIQRSHVPRAERMLARAQDFRLQCWASAFPKINIVVEGETVAAQNNFYNPLRYFFPSEVRGWNPEKQLSDYTEFGSQGIAPGTKVRCVLNYHQTGIVWVEPVQA